jgi:ABC-2 type transport system permease protein
VTDRPAGLVFRSALRGTWRSTAAWAALFGVSVAAVAGSYETLYATAADRAAVAALIEGNRAFEALFGQARAMDTAAGFTAWRLGTPASVVVALLGIFGATRLLRGEEEAGRWETLLAGALTPARATAATIAAVATSLSVVAAALFAGLAAAGLGGLDAAVYAVQIGLFGIAFAAIGALTAQLVPARRRAAGMAAAVLGVAYLLRVLADGTEGFGWLRGATPFGWIESTRAYVDVRPAWLLPLALWSLAAAGAAVILAGRRDLGAGWLSSDDERDPSTRLLGSAEVFALRTSLRPAVVWSVTMAVFAGIFGFLASEIVEFLAESDALDRFTASLGAGFDVDGTSGFLGMTFTFVALPVSLAGVYRIIAAREEEATARLDVLLAGDVRRARWLLTWAGVAVATAAVVALVAGVAAFGIAALRGGDLSPVQGLAAAANMLPAAVLFVGVATLAFAVVPRWTAPLAVGAVGAAELLALLGAQRAVPDWLRDLSPFAHVRPVPAVDANLAGAAALVTVGVVAALAGASLFARRDVGA